MKGTSDMSTTIWGVTSYDLGGNTGYVVHALFTTHEAAEKYASEDADYSIEEFDLYDEAPAPYAYWHRGAEVFPDATVKDWIIEHSAQPPSTMAPVDDHMEPWDGHTQGHCGLHISIFGTDREAVENAYQRQLAEALTASNGTCPDCGKTSDWLADFRDEESIDVVLVGGPKDGDITQAVRDRRWDPMPDGLICLHGNLAAGLTDSYYGPIDREGERWVRRHVRSRKIADGGQT